MTIFQKQFSDIYQEKCKTLLLTFLANVKCKTLLKTN